MKRKISGQILLLVLFQVLTESFGLDCVQCSTETSRDCSIHPGPPERCPDDSMYCVTIKQYTPNLQDDSDANYNDQAGRRIKLERGCDKSNSSQGCNNRKFGDRAVVECMTYCDQNGCNFAYGLGSGTLTNIVICLCFVLFAYDNIILSYFVKR